MSEKFKVTTKSVRTRLALLALASELNVPICEGDGNAKHARSTASNPVILFDLDEGFGFGEDDSNFTEVSVGGLVQAMEKNANRAVKLNDETTAIIEPNGDVEADCQYIERAKVKEFVELWTKLDP